MADPLITTTKISKTATVTEDASLAAKAANLGAKRGAGALGHLGGIWLGVSTVLLAALSQWDHHVEKKRIAKEYDEEIAATLGKRPENIKIDDMEAAAKDNPAIKEALRRSTTRRNLSIAVTVVAAAAALLIIAPAAAALVAWAIPSLVAGGLAESLVVGGVTALGFLGVESGLEKIGEKKFHLEEPSLKSVARKPHKQSELSVPSQITHLSHQQAKGKLVTQEQVMTVFTSADAKLDDQIKARYGNAFAKLDENTKRQAITRFGSELNVEQLTADINSHNMRPQELAFVAYGQESGVPRISTRIGSLQRQADMLNAQIAAQAPMTNDDIARPRTGFRTSRVSISGSALQEAATQEDSAWRKRIDSQRRQQVLMGGVA